MRIWRWRLLAMRPRTWDALKGVGWRLRLAWQKERPTRAKCVRVTALHCCTHASHTHDLASRCTATASCSCLGRFLTTKCLSLNKSWPQGLDVVLFGNSMRRCIQCARQDIERRSHLIAERRPHFRKVPVFYCRFASFLGGQLMISGRGSLSGEQ